MHIVRYVIGNDPQGRFAATSCPCSFVALDVYIDAARTALGLWQIAGNKSTQDPRVAYALHPTDGNLNFL